MITSAPSGADVPIVVEGMAADIYVDPDDHAVVGIAGEDFQADVERVTGVEPSLYDSLEDVGRQDSEAETVEDSLAVSRVAVVAGTVGNSSGLTTCLQASSIDGDELAQRRESYVVETVQAPTERLDAAVVIAGSDRRGTAYGIYDLARAMGVSPWYWWADVKSDQRETVAVEAGVHRDGPPSVTYRGIFLNDEDFGLRPWASETHAPEDGEQSGIGPTTYERIFELLLRLKANTIWPAMHPGTKAFYEYDDHADLADDYAIVVGTSHCEPMHRNNVGEWNRPDADWNYVTNGEGIREYWRSRVEDVADCENVFTIGMRGIHDSPLPGLDTLEERIDLLTEVIDDQRELLADAHNRPAETVPQAFCPYKEVLDVYRGGLNVPEDVCIVWPDDSHGYLRELPTPEERERTGGHGVYYHLSYWGRPHDFLWLSSVPLGLINHELTKAYDAGAREYWVFNVGDIKPAETELEYALDLAWDVEGTRQTSTMDWLESWARRDFGDTHASDVARILSEYYRLAQSRKPEHMAWSTVYPDTPPDDPAFSLTHGGDEARQRVEAFDRLAARATDIQGSLPESKRAGFYQLVTYPVVCASAMTETHLAALRSRRYAGQGRASAPEHAERAKQAHDRIAMETRYYNEELSGGKWDGMMSHSPRDLPAFDLPPMGDVGALDSSALGVVPEGHVDPVTEDAVHPPSLPTFDRRTDRERFLDLFARGTEAVEWTATPNEEWITLSRTDGQLAGAAERRLRVGIDWNRAPAAATTGTITVEAAGTRKEVRVETAPAGRPDADFAMIDGVAALEAEHATRRIDGDRAHWTDADAPGRLTGLTVAVAPNVFDSFDGPGSGDDAGPTNDPPKLAFDIDVPDTGEVTVDVYCLPTQSLNEEHDLRYGAVFGTTREVVSIDPAGGEHDPEWQQNVLRGGAVGSSTHDIETEGVQTLAIEALDPGLVVDRIVVRTATQSQTYHGPRETRCSE